MHKTTEEVEQFVANILSVTTNEQTDAIICAPFIHLKDLVAATKDTDIHIAAQTMHEADEGAFTGEVSPLMLKDIGVTHVIIGHSERREYFNETDESVNKKVKATHRHGITPIICVGESLEQRESGETLQHIESQVTKALTGLSNDEIASSIIAYEPIWAIGTGKTATSDQANEVCAHIRSVIAKLANDAVANDVVIQYGGSVNPDNIDDLLSKSDIDGALVGGASLDAASFQQLIEAGKRAS